MYIFVFVTHTTEGLSQGVHCIHREGYLFSRYWYIGLKNGINLYNFSTRNGINYQDFGTKYKVGYNFRKIGIRSGILFQKMV